MSRPITGYQMPEGERETQITDGLRWADCLLASFGMDTGVDVSSLVALRAIEWADDDMPVREVRRILEVLTGTRKVSALVGYDNVRPMAATTLHAQSRVCPPLSVAVPEQGAPHAAQ